MFDGIPRSSVSTDAPYHQQQPYRQYELYSAVPNASKTSSSSSFATVGSPRNGAEVRAQGGPGGVVGVGRAHLPPPAQQATSGYRAHPKSSPGPVSFYPWSSPSSAPVVSTSSSNPVHSVLRRDDGAQTDGGAATSSSYYSMLDHHRAWPSDLPPIRLRPPEDPRVIAMPSSSAFQLEPEDRRALAPSDARSDASTIPAPPASPPPLTYSHSSSKTFAYHSYPLHPSLPPTSAACPPTSLLPPVSFDGAPVAGPQSSPYSPAPHPHAPIPHSVGTKLTGHTLSTDSTQLWPSSLPYHFHYAFPLPSPSPSSASAPALPYQYSLRVAQNSAPHRSSWQHRPDPESWSLPASLPSLLPSSHHEDRLLGASAGAVVAHLASSPHSVATHMSIKAESTPSHEIIDSNISNCSLSRSVSVSSVGGHEVGEGKKKRKRRRRANEEPRDAALRRFPCHLCGKMFARPSALRTHERSHSKERPHVCPEPTCQRPFAVASNLRRHQKVYGHCVDDDDQEESQELRFASPSRRRRHDHHYYLSKQQQQVKSSEEEWADDDGIERADVEEESEEEEEEVIRKTGTKTRRVVG